MYKFSVEQVMDPRLLSKLIARFKHTEILRYQKCQRYYDVKTDVLKRSMQDDKPNNRLAHGFARYISNMATAYFAGKSIKWMIEDEEYKNAFEQVLSNNYVDSLHFNASKESSKKGVAYLLLFLDESGELRIKKCAAEEIIPVYSPDLNEFLEAAIRIWVEYDFDGKLQYEYAALYTQTDIILYRRDNLAKDFEIYDASAHLLSDVPIVIIWNNEEQCGDYEPHIPLMDAYDKSQSDTANDMEYFTDAYLCVAGASGGLENALTGEDSEETDKAVRDLRNNRILLLDEKGQADWLVKNINDTAQENYKDRLYKNIFFLAQVPNLSDESFAGNLTGVAIRYKLIGLEELAIMKQNCMEAALAKLTGIVTEYLNKRYNKQFVADEVTRKYERNFIDNITELIDNAAKLEAIVSKETQLSVLPKDIVPSAENEMDKIKKESAEMEGIPYIDRNI